MSFPRWTRSLSLATSAPSEPHYQRALLELCAEVCGIHISHKSSKDCMIMTTITTTPLAKEGATPAQVLMPSRLRATGRQYETERLAKGWSYNEMSSSPLSSPSPHSEEPHRTGRKLRASAQMKTKEAVRTRLVSHPGVVPPFCAQIQTGKIRY